MKQDKEQTSVFIDALLLIKSHTKIVDQMQFQQIVILLGHTQKYKCSFPIISRNEYLLTPLI